MKRLLLIGVLAVLLCGCGNRKIENKTDKAKILENAETVDTIAVAEEFAIDTLVTEAEPVEEISDDSTTVHYLKALPTGYKEDDCFGLVLDYGGYGMDVAAWPMPDGDWLITWHWCMEEDESGTITFIDTDGIEKPVVYNDPFAGQPYPVIHKPDLSFSTRNYGGETINFYAAPDSEEVLCSTNKEIDMDVVAADLKTRRLLVRTNPNDWFWEKPGEEAVNLPDIAPVEGESELDFEEKRHPFVDLKGWIDEEWVCGNTMTTCP